MKRSRIFLGATTTLLAVAGLVAAKRFDAAKTRWYVGDDGLCHNVAKTFKYVTPGTPGAVLAKHTIGTGPGALRYTLFTKGALDAGGNPQPPSITPIPNCVTPLYYTRND